MVEQKLNWLCIGFFLTLNFEKEVQRQVADDHFVGGGATQLAG
jgi:hypothetical protein